MELSKDLVGDIGVYPGEAISCTDMTVKVFGIDHDGKILFAAVNEGKEAYKEDLEDFIAIIRWCCKFYGHIG